jgi:4-amino-4-deoxy-L-arabinose transferase-like glycosyltransferase
VSSIDMVDSDRRSAASHAWIVAGVAFVAAMAVILFLFRSQGVVSNPGDPYDYGRIAHGFVEHGFDKLTRRAASLYPELLAIIYRLGGNDFVVQLLHAFLHVGTCLLVFSLGRRLYNARTALIAGLLCALNPMFLRYVADLHMETALTFMVTLTVWCAVRFYDRPNFVNGILFGAVGIITTMTKGVILPFVVLFGGIMFLSGFRRQQGKPDPRGPVVAMFVTMALLLAPWTYRNYQVTGGRFVLLTPGASDSFLRGYVFTRLEFATLQKEPYVYAEQECNAWFREIASEAGTTWEADEVVDEKNNARVVKKMIATHPLDTVRKVVVGFFTFWYEMTNLTNSLLPLTLAIVSWVLAFVGWRRAHDEGRPSWLLFLPIVVMNVFVATLIPLGRYSVPILPCLFLLAAFGADTVLARLAAKNAGRSPEASAGVGSAAPRASA